MFTVLELQLTRVFCETADWLTSNKTTKGKVVMQVNLCERGKTSNSTYPCASVCVDKESATKRERQLSRATADIATSGDQTSAANHD